MNAVVFVGIASDDSQLLTQRTVQALRRATYVVCDSAALPLATDIAPAAARVVRSGSLNEHDVRATLVAEARAGQHVVRVIDDDPTRDGRAVAERAYCSERDVPVQTIASVSSSSVAANMRQLPLHGVRVAVTRAAHQAGQLRDELAQRGARIDMLPLVQVEVCDVAATDALLAQLRTFDWLVFTSANAIRVLGERLSHQKLDARVFASTRLACVGPTTQRALSELGLRADVVPDALDVSGAALVDSLGRSAVYGSRVALVQSRSAQRVVADGLTRFDCDVHVVAAYDTTHRTLTDGQLRQLHATDIITLCSGSAARSLAQQLAPDALDASIVTLGATATEAAQAAGWSVAAQADKSSLSALCDAVERVALTSRSPPRIEAHAHTDDHANP